MEDTYDFDSTLSQLEQIAAWLKSRGHVTAHRFGRCAANIREMLELERAGKIEEYQRTISEARAREIMWCYVDADEFVRAISSLRASFGDDIPNAPIERALHGPADVFVEDHTNAAGRNFMFELIMGARLAAAKLNPTFERPDLHFTFAGLDVALQCKRPLNFRALERNISKGIKQLRDDHAELRLLAISVSRIIFGSSAVAIPEVVDPESGHKYLESRLQEIAEHSQRFWKGKAGCDGILFYTFIPIRSRRSNGRPFFSFYRHEIAVPTVSGSANALILKCLSQAVGN